MTFSHWKIAGPLAVVLVLGAGCFPTPEPPVSSFDVTQTTCEGIADARQTVLQNYAQAVEEAGKTYVAAHQAFRDALNECQRGIWTGGPCDAEYKETQVAYEKAWGNISSDEAYHGWKAAKKNWDECYGNYEAKQKEWSENNLKKEKQCQEEFQAKSDAASAAHRAAVDAAKAKRDSDLAWLDEFEKKCKEPKAGGGGDGTVGTVPGGTGTPVPPTAPPGKPAQTPPTPPTTLPASACAEPGIPGSQGTPRQGQSPDYGPKDIAVNLMTTVAEEVTKTPLPISAIDNQIFAGIVVAKINSRIAEMIIEESDAQLSGDRTTEIRLRKKIAQYQRAAQVWGAIAAGKKPLAEVKKDVAALNAMPSGFCKKDADCSASPLCCSVNTIARSHCDVETGACVAQIQNCGGSYVCMGPDSLEPRYDHCGPAHEGNWTFGGQKPGNWSHPQPGVPRVSAPGYGVEVRMGF